MTSVWTHLRLGKRDERGQALVEFALLAPLFFMLVIGVIQVAVALNFWFDLQRLANQGARSAAVNCGVIGSTSQCGSTTLANYLSPGNPDGQIVSAGNQLYGGNNPTAPASQWGGTNSAEICYVVPAGSDPNSYKASAGDAVRVVLRDKYQLQSIVNLAKIDLKATATMRLDLQPNGGLATGPLPNPGDSAYWVLPTHTGSAPCQP